MNLALEIKGSPIELDEFNVYDARAGPIRHRQTVSPRASWIGRAQIDLAQSTGCQHGKFGQSPFHLPARPLQKIRAHTGLALIDGQPVGP